jgi:hypothetical protein
VAAVDPAEVLETARVEREARKRAYEPAGEEDR